MPLSNSYTQCPEGQYIRVSSILICLQMFIIDCYDHGNSSVQHYGCIQYNTMQSFP